MKPVNISLLLPAVLCVMIAAASAAKPKDLSVLGLDDEVEDPFDNEDSYTLPNRSNIGDLANVIFGVKNQFREIIEEIGLQIFKFIASYFHHFKVKLLRKLGMYTLSDVFHTVFDGVTEFVTDSASDVGYYDNTKEPASPSLSNRPPYGLGSPYGLTSFLRQQNK